MNWQIWTMYDSIFRALASLLMQHRGLLWPFRKSSALFILYPRCSYSNPSNTCNKRHMSRAGTLTPSFHAVRRGDRLANEKGIKLTHWLNYLLSPVPHSTKYRLPQRGPWKSTLSENGVNLWHMTIYPNLFIPFPWDFITLYPDVAKNLGILL